MCILRSQFCLQYETIQRFCKTWHALNFNFTLIMKFNLENRIIYLYPNVAGFLKNVFKRPIRAQLKKKNWRTSILMWLGRESVQNVTRTRKWDGSHSTPQQSRLKPGLRHRSGTSLSGTFHSIRLFIVVLYRRFWSYRKLQLSIYLLYVLCFSPTSHDSLYSSLKIYTQRQSVHGLHISLQMARYEITDQTFFQKFRPV